jgi:glycosyltransferase involved in cell wall biosynthesis
METKRKKFLISLFRFPYPASDGTKRRIVENVIQGLIKEFDLEFFVISHEQVSMENVKSFEERYGKVHLFTHSKFSMLWNATTVLFSKLPVQAKIFIYHDARLWLKRNVSRFDGVYVHEIRMTEYFIGKINFPKNKIIIDFNDAISLHYVSALPHLNFLKKLFYMFEYKRVKRYESKVLQYFQIFTIISEQDKAYLLNLDDKKTYQKFISIPFGFNAPELTPIERKLPSIFFIGNINYGPNRDAVQYFLDKIWPIVRLGIPGLSFTIIGKGNLPPKYKSIEGVKFTGFVEDASVIQNYLALVAPIRFGGGVPTKVLEAMSFGIPVIASKEVTLGLDGLKNGENIITCSIEDIEDWVKAIQKIYLDEEFRKKVGDSGRNLIKESYSLESSQRAYRELATSIT